MLHAKRLINGIFKEVPEEKASHVVLTLDEADSLALDMDTFESERDDARISANDLRTQIEELKQTHNREMMRTIERLIDDEAFSVKQAKEDAEKKYSELEEKYSEALQTIKNLTEDKDLLQDEYDREKGLNRMFRRMARQRANQNNGQPRKSGCGYVVVSSMQVKDRVWDDYMVDAWKTILRTPYAVELPLKMVYRDIRSDLIFEVLGTLGISRLQAHSKNGNFQIWHDEEDSKKPLNGIYRWCYRINSRENCWEIELYHNLPLLISADMLPQKGTGGKCKSRK